MKKLILILFAAIILISSVTAISAQEIDESQLINLESGNPTISADNSDLNNDNFANVVSQDSNSTGAFLVLDNDADKENIYIGEYVTWILEAQNFGPEIAKNTKIYDKLPEGLEYIKHSATKGTFDSKTGIWDIGDLKVEDGIVTLLITTKAITAGEKVNKAYITSDTVNTNNETYEEEEIDVFEKDDSSKEHVSAKMYEAGNPIFLALISLFLLLIPIRK